MRTTIDVLNPDEIFVFGSNLAGFHGAGAAKRALTFGAQSGCGMGTSGHTYAIATKDHRLRVLPLSIIDAQVEVFTHVAESLPFNRFLVTDIGCGFAGYVPGQIAPMFLESSKLRNVYFSQRFCDAMLAEDSFANPQTWTV